MKNININFLLMSHKPFVLYQKKKKRKKKKEPKQIPSNSFLCIEMQAIVVTQHVQVFCQTTSVIPVHCTDVNDNVKLKNIYLMLI
jgi:hypothetical protein